SRRRTEYVDPSIVGAAATAVGPAVSVGAAPASPLAVIMAPPSPPVALVAPASPFLASAFLASGFFASGFFAGAAAGVADPAPAGAPPLVCATEDAATARESTRARPITTRGRI